MWRWSDPGVCASHCRQLSRLHGIVSGVIVPMDFVHFLDSILFSIRMICILGHNSGFPCPICLVPRLEQSKLGKVWPIRTVAATEAILERARHSETKAEKDKILHEQSLRDIRVSGSNVSANCTLSLRTHWSQLKYSLYCRVPSSI